MKPSAHLHVLGFVLMLCISQSVSQQAYYPLSAGNAWQFSDDQHQTRAIGDTILPDGYSYNTLLDTWYNVREYQRSQGDSIFQPGLLLYDFSVSPGDTIASTANGYVCVLLSIDTAEVLGRTLRQWVFGRTWGPFTGEVDYVTDSLGVSGIFNAEPPTQKLLTGARIDGVTYGLIASVRTNIGLATPGRIVLGQNYPNPFNPTTTISFNLPQGADVKLEVFNILGQRLAILINGPTSLGEHSVQFDAGTLPSGVYTYRLASGEIVTTRMMVVLK